MSQERLAAYGADLDLDRLTDAERRAYVAVRLNGVGAKEHGLETGRSRRTVQNLLAKAERKLEGGSR
jgi:DNA-directed RNA polymerase specialized sigma24 family protein